MTLITTSVPHTIGRGTQLNIPMTDSQHISVLTYHNIITPVAHISPFHTTPPEGLGEQIESERLTPLFL